MWERTVTIGSAGKTFSVTGWKLGWSIGPKHLIYCLCMVHQNCNYTCPTPLQVLCSLLTDSLRGYFDLLQHQGNMQELMEGCFYFPAVPSHSVVSPSLSVFFPSLHSLLCPFFLPSPPLTSRPLKMICNDFLVVKVNCLSSVFNIMKSRNVKNTTILEKKRLKVLTR